MEKINRPALNTISSLVVLNDNWEEWGREYERYLISHKKNEVGFSWRKGIYTKLRNELNLLAKEHCTFCDGYPFDMSKETIEHYRPKNIFPLEAYDWNNLFYSCDSCQSYANKTPFEETLKPDHRNYLFDAFFYVDLEDFKIKVLEILEQSNKKLFDKSNSFLERYGLNHKNRVARRRNLYRDLKLYFKEEYGEINSRVRDDFPFRYMYDLVDMLPK